MTAPREACASRLAISSQATAPIDGRASPRKPSVEIRVKSPSGNFDVAWRSTQSSRSAEFMPLPLSTTRMSLRPPASMAISIRLAPASRAFSTSSLTAAAGRLDDFAGGDAINENGIEAADRHDTIPSS